MKLNTGQINELARLAAKSEVPLPRTANRQKAIERLQRLLHERTGDDGWFNSLLAMDANDELAFESARIDLSEDTGQERPVEPFAPASQPDATAQKPAVGERKAKRATTPRPGRWYAACTIWPGVVQDGIPLNPRRAGTFGHKSHQLIIQRPGIAYRDYKKEGGRNNDLKWDWDRGWVVIRDEAGEIVANPNAIVADDSGGSTGSTG
jgi:hypothetical protein